MLTGGCGDSFNRTSMESKHFRGDWRLRASGFKLLIEPVWNRNAHELCARMGFRGAFNRTSMESKRRWTYTRLATLMPAFNRTSMESKLRTACYWLCEKPNLLIEPVWNRNWCGSLETSSPASCLLIEPVWNRNVSSAFTVSKRVSTFNRTSMESKHAFDKWQRLRCNILLIEPVWNRNFLVDKVLFVVFIF